MINHEIDIVKLRGKDKKAKSAKERKAAPLKPEAKAKSKTDNVDPSIVESCKMFLNELNIGAGDISLHSSPHKIIRRRENSLANTFKMLKSSLTRKRTDSCH